MQMKGVIGGTAVTYTSMVMPSYLSFSGTDKTGLADKPAKQCMNRQTRYYDWTRAFFFFKEIFTFK